MRVACVRQVYLHDALAPLEIHDSTGRSPCRAGILHRVASSLPYKQSIDTEAGTIRERAFSLLTVSCDPRPPFR